MNGPVTYHDLVVLILCLTFLTASLWYLWCKFWICLEVYELAGLADLIQQLQAAEKLLENLEEKKIQKVIEAGRKAS